jgi:hypothetical protein
MLYKVNSPSPTQVTPRFLWTPKVHCRVHKRPPQFPIFSQVTPVHVLTHHFIMIHFNIILASAFNEPVQARGPAMVLSREQIISPT